MTETLHARRWDTEPAPVILGHMVVPPNATDQWLMVDVRRWLSERAEPRIRSLMIVRPFRYDANALLPGDLLAFSNVVFDSREGPEGLRPRLSVQFVAGGGGGGKALEQPAAAAASGGAAAAGALAAEQGREEGPADGAGVEKEEAEPEDGEDGEASGEGEDVRTASASPTPSAQPSSGGGGGAVAAAHTDSSESSAKGGSGSSISSSPEAQASAGAAARHWYSGWRGSRLPVLLLLLALPVLCVARFVMTRRNASVLGSLGVLPKRSRKRRAALGWT